MALAGNIFDFVNRSRQNRELMKANRNRRARMREMYANSVSKHQISYKGEKISAEELMRIKNDIRKIMQKEARKNVIWAAMIALAVVIAGFFLLQILI